MSFKGFLKSSLVGCLLLAPVAASSDGIAGSYLSANFANSQNDYKSAARYFLEALDLDPNNLFLLQNALLSVTAKGDVEEAVKIAQKISILGEPNQLSDLILLTDAIKGGDYDASARMLSKDGNTFTALMRGLISGWVELGRGKMAAATAIFDEMKAPPAVQLFGQYHKALTLATVGDFGGADKILQGDERGTLRLNRGSLVAHAQILSQLDRAADAQKLLEDSLQGTTDLQLQQLLDQVKAGETLDYTFVSNASEGAAEVFYTLASALLDDNNPQSSLLYARLAEYLRPNYTPSILLAADILRDQEQYDLATEIYAKVSPDDVMYLDAELGRSETLINAEKPDAAIEVLRNLARTHSNIPRVHMSLGDVLRGEENYADARDAYEKAVELIETPQRNHWFLYYAMAITSERLDDWDRAEADFRTALELNPGQPLVLNYLGYSLVEKNIKLDEAQDMIKSAVEQRPESGYITDSLGWIYYTLGKYEDAVAPMELAVELIPDDPIINDHLGDVYWMVGRQREAEFQWKRALSFEPEDEEATRIRTKLQVGLDKVLENEKALKTAKDDGN